MLLIAKTAPGVLSVTIDRREKRNALSPGLVAELTRFFADIGSEAQVRVVVLGSAGAVFCAGGDVDSLRQLADASEAATTADAQSFIDLFHAVASCPVPVVARVQGAALGGGTALAACADIVVAARSASFGCTEVRVGIVPAVVAPYVVARLGIPATRRLMLTGERLNAAEAHRLGLVDELCDDADLDERVAAVVAFLLRGHRPAQLAVKALLTELPALDAAGVDSLTLSSTVRSRMSEEGRHAMGEFLAGLRGSEA